MAHLNKKSQGAAKSQQNKNVFRCRHYYLRCVWCVFNPADSQTPICSRLWKFRNRYKIPVHPGHPSVSQFILEANRQPKSIGEKISACHEIFLPISQCPDLIRNRRLSVFIGVYASLSQSILVYRGSQIGVYRWPKFSSWPAFCSPIDAHKHQRSACVGPQGNIRAVSYRVC